MLTKIILASIFFRLPVDFPTNLLRARKTTQRDEPGKKRINEGRAEKKARAPPSRTNQVHLIYELFGPLFNILKLAMHSYPYFTIFAEDLLLLLVLR